MMKLKLFIILLLSLNVGVTQAAEFGLASVYSDAYDGSTTSSGETYNATKLTAAHKSLPYGSIVKVTNMQTKRTVLVTINDRGPFIKGYVIELSKAAANVLGIKDNKGKVKLTVEKRGDNNDITEAVEEYDEASDPFSEVEKRKEKTEASTPDDEDDTSSRTVADAVDSSSELKESKVTEKKVEKKKTETEDVLTAKSPSNKEKNTVQKPRRLAPLKTKGYKKFDLYKVSTFEPKKQGYGVQVGLYKELTNVLQQTAILQENWFSNIMLHRSLNADKTAYEYRLMIGPFDELASANHYLKDIKKKGVKGFVSAIQPTDGLEMYQIKALRLNSDGYAVQIMNLKDEDNVILEIDKLRKKWFKNILLNVTKGENGKANYKILLGPLPDKARADAYVKSLKKDKKMNSFPVDLSTIK